MLHRQWYDKPWNTKWGGYRRTVHTPTHRLVSRCQPQIFGFWQKRGKSFLLRVGAILQCNKCTRYTGKTCSLTYIFGMLWNHTLIDRLAKRDIVVIRRGENWPWIVHHGTTLLATILRNLENKMVQKNNARKSTVVDVHRCSLYTCLTTFKNSPSTTTP